VVSDEFLGLDIGHGLLNGDQGWSGGGAQGGRRADQAIAMLQSGSSFFPAASVRVQVTEGMVTTWSTTSIGPLLCARRPSPDCSPQSLLRIRWLGVNGRGYFPAEKIRMRTQYRGHISFSLIHLNSCVPQQDTHLDSFLETR
jgi:hypothetical protein